MKIHILTASGNLYRVVIHTPTPAGNNSVGVSWQTAGLNSGLLGSTVMAVGTGAGQISSTEQTQILAGSVIEIVAQICAESGGTTSASIDAMANQIITDYQNKLATMLKYYGYTQ